MLRLLLVLVAACRAEVYLFDRPVYTGLGDRMGTVFSLAALAHPRDTVLFVWNEDRARITPHHAKWVPKWEGFDYPLPQFVAKFAPAGIEFVGESALNESHWALPKVKRGRACAGNFCSLR